MKKILMLSAAVLAISAGPALADHHEGGEGKKDWHGKMWDKVDANEDGLISKEEFLTKSEEKFTKIDADGDGSITEEEMKSHHEAMREKMMEHRQKRQEGKTEDAAPADDTAPDAE